MSPPSTLTLTATLLLSLGAQFAMAQTPASAPAAATAEADDPFLWLEDVSGGRATDWVAKENARTLSVLTGDTRFEPLEAQALKIAEAKDRIPSPAFIQGRIYNFWQDADHVRGLWRRATLKGYARTTPDWTTVLDLDALSKAENANWVWHGADCAWPRERRCLLDLSDGGEDADTVREFDLTTRKFVDGGFTLPRGKQVAAWRTENTLLVAREWTPGELTESGYAYVVKQLKRGQPLAAATEVFRGAKTDVGVDPVALHDGQGRVANLIIRRKTFFETEHYLVDDRGVRRLALPAKIDLQDLVGGQLLFLLAEDWKTLGTSLPQGSLVSIDLAAASADPEHLKPTLVLAPGPRESIATAGATRSRLFVVVDQNVKGRAFVFTPKAGGRWDRRRLPLPDNSAVSLATTDAHGDKAFIGVTSFLTPPTVWLADGAAGAPVKVKSLPAKFDASRDKVEQFEATSSDGTRIPYFVVHPTSMRLDGSNPTILNAYGGFQVSEQPRYSGVMGKLWLERGGVFVLANIRGGGEFGPAWHEAGLKTHRQRIYDDFAAVARDLVARKITSPRRLGIEGGSNGGLLMGVEFTQHPELWRAVDIQVPLLDMLRFEKIAAGSSWVGEYGSVANPDERAFLASISPYNNLKAGVDYPEPLIWTTTKDDRVGPQHARKFAAKLSAMGRPYLFYEVTEGGHGAGANLKESARTNALEMTYFIRKLVD